ncbi:hypothetical protein L0337_44085 [candidate division KSB1 bacterium]|nr:hypothetical protein [candidate division KSB1 bacterium]
MRRLADEIMLPTTIKSTLKPPVLNRPDRENAKVLLFDKELTNAITQKICFLLQTGDVTAMVIALTPMKLKIRQTLEKVKH